MHFIDKDFGDVSVKEAVHAALVNITAAQNKGTLTKVREHLPKGRTAWRLILPEGGSAFVKCDELDQGGKWYHRFYSMHPFNREAQLLEKLHLAELGVPRPIMVAADPGLLFPKRVFLVTEAMEGYEPLSVTIERHLDKDSTLPEELMGGLSSTLAQLLYKLHKIGFYHRDLQEDHILWKVEDGEIKWALVDFEGAFIKRQLPMWYRIKNLYMVGRHLLNTDPPNASIEFIEEYNRLSFPGDDPKQLIKVALRYAAFREDGRDLGAMIDKTIMDYIDFARKHRRVSMHKIQAWFK